MPRLYATTRLANAPDVIVSDPASWLPRPARPAGLGDWMVDLRLGRIHRAVRVHVGTTWNEEDGIRRVVRWHAEAEPGDALPFHVLLPHCTGQIVATPGRLEIEAQYEPPASVLGRTADLLLRHLARSTVQTLVDDIATVACDPAHQEA